MSSKYLVVVGDPTTGGGEAVEGDSGWMIRCVDGTSRPVVRVGDAVICSQCGPTKVAQGVASFMSGGGLVAYDGCALACGHQMIASSQRLCRAEVNDGPRLPSNAASSFTRSGKSQSQAAPERFDEGFQFIDTAVGKPLVGLECLLFPERAAEIPGHLGESGCSPRCNDDTPTRVVAAIEAPSPLLL